MDLLTNEQIARLAELVAAKELSRPVWGRYRRPLFRVVPLGDKYPTVDFLVDVLGRNDRALGLFFAQVKGTTTATVEDARLPVDVSPDRFNRLVRLPVPTYLIGVDVLTETAYIVAAHRPRRARVSSLTKAFCLRDDSVIVELYKEVRAFWKANKPVHQPTRFQDV